jgi:hypothetical protein
MEAGDRYCDLMAVVRGRLDFVANLDESQRQKFVYAETSAFHGRKIVEAIAFGCLLILDHSMRNVPRDAKGQWNAESILASLKSKSLDVLPSPSIIRPPSLLEINDHNPRFVVQGVPEHRLTLEDLLSIYRRLHPWLHEINPYVGGNRVAFLAKHSTKLWNDLSRLDSFLDSHVLSIRGRGLLCVLRDKVDGMTRVVPLNQLDSALPINK